MRRYIVTSNLEGTAPFYAGASVSNGPGGVAIVTNVWTARIEDARQYNHQLAAEAVVESMNEHWSTYQVPSHAAVSMTI